MKDPAFLFYPGDFTDGTQHFTNEEVGAYVRILMLQFSQGHLPFDYIERRLRPDCERLWPVIGYKFSIDDQGYYYNKRMEEEQLKRKNFVKSRHNNLAGKNQYN